MHACVRICVYLLRAHNVGERIVCGIRVGYALGDVNCWFRCVFFLTFGGEVVAHTLAEAVGGGFAAFEESCVCCVCVCVCECVCI